MLLRGQIVCQWYSHSMSTSSVRTRTLRCYSRVFNRERLVPVDRDLKQRATVQCLGAEYFDSSERNCEGRMLFLWPAAAPIVLDMLQEHGRPRRHS
jgi:hypothetical protein